MTRRIVSLSGGKDSTAMLHIILEKGLPFDEVLFFDGGWEFPEMYDHLELVEQKTGVVITRLKPDKPFVYYMREHILTRGTNKGMRGYGWPWRFGRWCTRIKINTLIKHNKDSIQYVGIAFDETKRMKDDKTLIYPLVENHMTEKDCLEYCYKLGYTWGGLYEHMNRVSCYCCPLQRTAEIQWLYNERPELWQQMRDMDAIIGTIGGRRFHSHTLAEWEERFEKEKARYPLFDGLEES